MRTYEHGILWTELKVTCSKCKCDFIFRPKDLKEHIAYDFDTQSGHAYRYVPCPECGNHYVYVDPTDNKRYDDKLVGITIDPSQVEVIYDGGDEDHPVVSE